MIFSILTKGLTPCRCGFQLSSWAGSCPPQEKRLYNERFRVVTGL